MLKRQWIFLLLFTFAKPLPAPLTINECKTHLSARTILVVDDDPLTRSLYQAILADYTVEEAKDGREALDKYSAQPERFGIIVTDVEMRTMNGLQFALEVHKLNPAMRILICSGKVDSKGEFVSDDLALNLLAAMVKQNTNTAFLGKPVSRGIFEQTIFGLIGKDPA